MTICIGAICNKGKAVIVATDSMVTAQFPPLQFEQPSSKLETLTDKSVFLIADDILLAAEVLKRTKAKLSSSRSTRIDDITKTVCESYKEYRQEIIEEVYLKSRALNLQLFYREVLCAKLPKELASNLDTSIINFVLTVQLIVAGIDEMGGHIYIVSNPGVSSCHDKIGCVAIGSGAMYAISTFILSNFSIDFGINQGVYYAFESKMSAEKAPGVGTGTNMAIITFEGIRILTQQEIELLKETCIRVTKPRVEEKEKAIDALPFEKESADESKHGS